MVIVGDFNMVESPKDRLNGVDLTIRGNERRKRMKCKGMHSLHDLALNDEFTWSNNRQSSLLKTTRLDRCYISSPLNNQFMNSSAKVLKSIALSNHYPIEVLQSKCPSGSTQVLSFANSYQ